MVYSNTITVRTQLPATARLTAVPGGLTAVRNTDGSSVVLSWNASATSPPVAANSVSYDVQFASGNPADNPLVLLDESAYSTISSGTDRTYTHTGRVPLIHYFYRVRARITTDSLPGGTSPWSAPTLSAATFNWQDARPMFGTPVVTSDSITLRWTRPTGPLPKSQLLNCRLLDGSNCAGKPPFPRGIERSGANANVHIHSDLTADTTYTYVLSVTTANDVVLTDTVVVTTAVTPPGNPSPPLQDIIPAPVAPPVVDKAAEAGHRSALPKLARVIGAAGTGAVVERVAQAFSGGGSGSGNGIAIGGQSSLAAAFASNAQSLADGSRNWRSVLAETSFAFAAGDSGGLSFWGDGEQHSVSADEDGGMPSLDGGLFSVSFGADWMFGGNLLGGVMVTSNQADLDYASATTNASGGNHEANITTVNPYLGWTTTNGGGWMSAGTGSGEVVVGEYATDAEIQLLGVGGHRRLDKTIAGRSLRINAEAHSTTINTTAITGLTAQSLGAQVVRVELDASDRKSTATGQRDFDVQLGLRGDGGDGRTGVGIEGGMRLASFNTANGVTVEGGARLLLGKSDYQEYGVYGLIQRAADRGRGLSLTLRPGYGNTATTSAVWDGDEIDATDDMTANLNAAAGYGIATASGIVTPYLESRLTGTTSTNRLGVRLKRVGIGELNLLGEHHRLDGVPTNTLLLKGTMAF